MSETLFRIFFFVVRERSHDAAESLFNIVLIKVDPVTMETDKYPWIIYEAETKRGEFSLFCNRHVSIILEFQQLITIFTE